jgi:glycosyltransferase involved in cell wall biosynthesis
MRKTADKRIRYEHYSERMAIGAKRNFLIEQARSPIVAHFDDDDHYSKGYLRRLMNALGDQKADFAKLLGFLFSKVHDVFRGMRFGFGFSYVFRRTVWESASFPDVDWNEDRQFAERAAERFKLIGLQDDPVRGLHVLHGSNRSRSFPQYVLPRFTIPPCSRPCDADLVAGPAA